MRMDGKSSPVTTWSSHRQCTDNVLFISVSARSAIVVYNTILNMLLCPGGINTALNAWIYLYQYNCFPVCQYCLPEPAVFTCTSIVHMYHYCLPVPVLFTCTSIVYMYQYCLSVPVSFTCMSVLFTWTSIVYLYSSVVRNKAYHTLNQSYPTGFGRS